MSITELATHILHLTQQAKTLVAAQDWDQLEAFHETRNQLLQNLVTQTIDNPTLTPEEQQTLAQIIEQIKDTDDHMRQDITNLKDALLREHHDLKAGQRMQKAYKP